MRSKKYKSIDEYISLAPEEAQKILIDVRSEVLKRIPTAVETISYNMPAFKIDRVFFYFAAFKKHLGIFPPVKDKILKSKLKEFMNEKGNLSFPYNKKVPIKLIGSAAVFSMKKYSKK